MEALKARSTDPEIPEPLRVNVPEAARIIGVSRTRLYKDIREGTIRAVKDGKRTLFSMKELREGRKQ